MALPEGYRPRKGDILSLRGVVRWSVRPSDDRVQVKIDGTYSESTSVALEDVVLERRAWEPEDKIQRRGAVGWDVPGEVLAVQGDFVWVTIPGDDEPETIHANDLEEWRDPKAPLEVDEAAVRAMTEADLTLAAISVAMKEPPPAPGHIANEDDDDFPF